MFRSQSSDHHQGSITVLVQLLHVHNQTPHGQVHRMHRRTDNIQPQTGI